ncbi:MAG: DUF2267 domain-containing protein [Candidatus Rokubacteria bacterium]|nr:DUF2267 domain-containing protein [Candidatus Rokubacteria bacterium]
MEEREFLARIQDLAGLPSSKEADRWAITVLLGLIHLLPDRHKRRRLITQLPGTVKARLQDEPPGVFLMDLDTFLQHVAAGLGAHAPEGARAVRVVYRALREAVSPGELARAEAYFPHDVATFLRHAA